MKPGQTDLNRRLASVHLGFCILCALLALPYLAAAFETWQQSRQFAAFAPYAEVLQKTTRDALVKGGISALGAAYFFWRWRALLRQQR